MAVHDYTDKGAVRKYGGGVLKLLEVTDSGADAAGDLYVLGYIGETELTYDKPLEDIKDETGAVINSLPGDVATGLKTTLMQSDKNILDFLRDNTEDQYYQLYYKMSPTNDMNGKTQELFAGICVVKPSFSVKSGTKRIPIEIKFLKNDSAITITDPDGTYGSIETDNVVIAAGGYYNIVEN